jgi:hypothetical protein
MVGWLPHQKYMRLLWLTAAPHGMAWDDMVRVAQVLVHGKHVHDTQGDVTQTGLWLCGLLTV